MNSAEASWLHTLYITYAETLYRIACYRLQDANRAQDLLHSVFLAAAQKVPALQAHENPLGWLLRALNYELSHEFARQAKQTAQEQPLHPSPAGPALPPGPGNSAPVLRGRAVLPGDRPASGGAGLHLRHLALPGQKALPRLSVPFPRFSRLRGVSMSHTTSSTRRAAAQRLLLETTLFQEETSLPRLQALLTTLEDQPPPAFSAEASWRQLQATHPDCFPLRRARAWRRWALAGSAAALAALVLLLPAQTKESTAPAPALSQDAVSQVIPTSAGLAALYDLAYLENLAPPSACPDVENLPFFLPGDTAPGHLPFDPEDKTQSIFLLEDAPLSPAPFSQDSVQNIPSEPASPETP